MDEKEHAFDELESAETGAPGEAAPEQDAESLKQALAEQRERAETYLANWQRAQADFINYKKRVEQERSDTTRFANASLIERLLPVLDDLERALESVPEGLAEDGWVDGINLIYRKFMSTLEELGLCQIVALGDEFDPHVHECVLVGEGEEGKVVEEFQKGYRLHDRVLRPARVKVGKEDEQAPDEEPQEEDNG
ncbi:MAG: nucleotide exchange factor GrpE [Chloroflexota bacterium]|nr:nucleotide exchange factor GrpE [Chloroflexota bacterium]